MTASFAAPAIHRIRSLLAAHAGLEPPEWVLSARLSERMSVAGIARGEDYVDLICSLAGSAELDRLVESLRVGETRFYRHAAQMRALRDMVVPRLNRSAPISAWSAGCASGEEAYTLAMLLSRGLARSTGIQVLGSDISASALELARAANYGSRAVEELPRELREWALSRNPDGSFSVRDHVRKLVRFEHRNLTGPNYPRDFDIICCRNVLMYMTVDAKRSVVERLIRSLKPGGFLLVGYAESLSGAEGVETVRTPDAVIYKRLSPEQARARPRPMVPVPSLAGQELITTISQTMPVVVEQATIELRGDYAEADRLSRELAPALRGPFLSVVVDLDGAQFLCDEAAVVLRRARAAANSVNIGFTIVAQRPGPLRWLRRHGFDEVET